MPENFADRLVAGVRAVNTPLCVGLDPHVPLIPELFLGGGRTLTDPAVADGVEAFVNAVVDRLADKVAVVKPQIALFEQLGWRGLRALERVAARARSLGLIVLLDAKRGDIGSTADGYARAYLEPDSPLRADALTVNPYMGMDTLEPFVTRCEAHGRGLFVLVKTSNPGSGDIQDALVDGAPLFERVAGLLTPACDKLVGPQTGWSSLGVVVGATYPAQADRIRDRLPKALFLIPGYGAQGATAADAVRSFVPGPHGGEGGIVNSSRGVLFPKGSFDSAPAWEAAFDAALDRAASELGDAAANIR